MPRPTGLWWDKQKKQWTVWHNGKRERLGKNKVQAEKMFHKLKSGDDTVPVAEGSINELIERLMDWTQANRAPRTYEWYQERIARFLAHVQQTYRRNLSVIELKPFHVAEWLDTQDWSDGYKRGCVVAIQRVFNFGVKQGYIRFNPLKGMEKPEAGMRDQLISESKYKKILEHSDQAFSDLLDFLWETGARPQEATRMRPKHAELEGGTITFPAGEAPKGKKARVIYLNDAAMAIVQRNMFNDPLLLNTKGRPWTAFAINCRFERLKKLLGVKYYAYAFRHTYGYRAWTSGKIPPEEIAKLMGHANTDMLYRVYGHIEQNPQYMRDAANRIA